MESLLLVSIGPVQPFIAAARRTRDLWFGSWLLSELSKAVARALVEQHAKLIFPASERPDQDFRAGSDLTVANKIVAIIKEPPSSACRAAEQAIVDRLASLRDQAFDALNNGGFDKEAAIKQLKDLIEFTWVAVPYLGKEHYRAARRNAEALLATRKGTRNFGPATWGETIPKSSIDGQYESVIHHMPAELRKRYNIKRGEQLSGIDLLKRFGQRGNQHMFLSTSHMAALPFMCFFDDKANTDIANAWNAYFRSLPQSLREHERTGDIFSPRSFFGHADGALLFSERLDFEVDGANDQSLKEALDKLEEFHRQVQRKYAIGRPLPYYAILQADGDGMGRIIDHEARKGPERHRSLSQALENFAQQARSIITSHQGAPVYVGGDDVLALLPLHTLLACLTKLDTTFTQTLAGFTNEKGEHPALSTGVAVVHHLMPLTDARELAHDAEHAAKTQVVGKNAIALTVSKRGGSDTTIDGKRSVLIERLEQAIDWHRRQLIPDGAAYDLRDVARRLSGPSVSQMDQATRNAVLRLEAERIIRRKVKNPDAQSAMLKRIKTDGSWRAEQFADEIIITRLFADAHDIAYGKVHP